MEYSLATIPVPEYCDEMQNLINQIPKNVDNTDNLEEIANSLAEMVEDVRRALSLK